MLILGHIEYSNCIPVHARLLEEGPPPGIEIRYGVPSELNAALRTGAVDVAPSSSIEYARNADRYRLLPGFAIGAVGAVQSVLLETARPAEALDGADVAVPTASATSVVLLRALLEKRYGVRPRYHAYEQSDAADPVRDGAAAALWIGDIALRRVGRTPHTLLDMGTLWSEWTGLPFVFALWQTSAGPERDEELLALCETFAASKRYFDANIETLARSHGRALGIDPARLASYWRSLEYGLDDRMQRGVLHFYRLAAELGEAPEVRSLRWVTC
ncbi:MAG TPA: menaquinone biosynthesis protein [Longimicrobiales bacterium]